MQATLIVTKILSSGPEILRSVWRIDLNPTISGLRGPNEEPLYDLPITLRSVENKKLGCNQARDRLRHGVRKDIRANMS